MPFDEDDQMHVVADAITSLTATAGTTDGTIADAGATYSQAVMNDNFRDVTAKINAILAALRAANIIAED